MKDHGKAIYIAAGAVIGYFIGFYEMKYKTMNALFTVLAEDSKKK